MGVNATDSNYSSQDIPENYDDGYDPSLEDPSSDYSPSVEELQKKADTYRANAEGTSQNYASGSKNLGMSGGTVARGNDVAQPGVDPQLRDYVLKLKSQGFSTEQIQEMVHNEFGYGVSAGDISFLTSGYESTVPSQYPQYNTMSKSLSTGYTSFGNDSEKLMKMMEDQQMMSDAKDSARQTVQNDKETKVKMNLILMQIMMGDIVGALRSYAVLRDRDARQFTQTIMDKLDKVRTARTQVIQNFGATTPPQAYAGNDSAEAARAQDRSSKYTQYVQMSTSLMSELQDTEKELMDAETEVTRDNQSFWESYAGFRDQEFKTADRVMSVR